jgi:hypothetical protein
MKDMQVHLEKLRTDAVECGLIRDLATDPAKRELFTRLAGHLETLATEVERAMAAASLTSVAGITQVNVYHIYVMGKDRLHQSQNICMRQR